MSPRIRTSTTIKEGASFLDPTSVTARLHADATRYMVGGTSRIHYYFQPHPIYARSGSGCRLTDVEGVTRLDFLNNMTSLIHGHSNPAINAALLDQIQRGTAFSEPSEPELGLARVLVDRVKSIEKIRFANSGTEAIMLAIKLARAFTGRSNLAKFEGFYHGYYDHVQVSYASGPGVWGPPEAPASVPSSGGLSESTLREVLVLPFNNRPAVERLLERHGAEIAAVIVDPLSNRAGFPQPAPGFLDFLRQATRDRGIVLIYDEVISFRLAYGGAQSKYGGDPDLTVLGKIIGGGLPIGAVGGRAEVMELLDPTKGSPKLASGGTFSGNPLSMAGGVAAMEQLSPAAYERLNQMGEKTRKEANAILEDAGVEAQLSGDGSLFRIIATKAPITNYRSMPEGPGPARTIAGLHLGLLENGVIISKDGLGCLSTPMTGVEVNEFLVAVARAVHSLPQA